MEHKECTLLLKQYFSFLEKECLGEISNLSSIFIVKYFPGKKRNEKIYAMKNKERLKNFNKK